MLNRIITKLKKESGLIFSKEKRTEEKSRLAFTDKINFLKNSKRYTEVSSDILGKPLLIPDAASFLFMYEEMFVKENYKFNSSKSAPVILDCGANIGLSVIYFKKIFPGSRIIAFEPDPKIFNILKKNISSFEYPDVQLLNNALWDEEKELDFYSEGADAGRIKKGENINSTLVKIKTLKLSDFLDKPVDLLKIDIEGAEFNVLKECESKLKNVEKIFLEYHSFINEEQHLDEILSILKKNGFRYNINYIGIVSKQPFISVNNYSGMDLQLNIFAFR